MKKVNAAVEEAARVSGASPWRALRDVTLPLLTPSVKAVVKVAATGARVVMPNTTAKKANSPHRAGPRWPIALAMILAFAQPLPVVGLRLYGTIWILLVAYVARFMNLGAPAPPAAASRPRPAGGCPAGPGG